MKTTEDINRYIAVEIMGKCWHERPTQVTIEYKDGSLGVYCKIEGKEVPMFNRHQINPDYCSDSSPRSLLNEVVAKVIELGRREEFIFALIAESRGITVQITGANTPAEQIARACVEAHKNAA